MPKFTFTSPQGKTYDIEGPEGATKEQAFQILQTQLGTEQKAPAAPAQPPQSIPGFVGGNIAKGVAGLVGPYAEMAQKAVNLPGDLANRAIEAVMGKREVVPKAAPLPVGTEALEAAGRKAGAITPSAEPRSTGQRYGAAALQALPGALMPGGAPSALGRIGGAVGAGLGGEAGRELGGVPGQLAGSVLGGAAGGMAGAQRGIPKPPTEARAAAERAGIPLTLGQETGKAPLRYFENMLRDWFPSAGTAEKDAARQVTAGANAVDRLATQISQRGTGDAEALGNQLRSVYKNTAAKLDKMRDAQAKVDYGAVRTLAGDKPVIQNKNTLKVLDQIIDENKGVPPGGDASKILAQAQKIRDFLTEQGAARVDDAMKTRSAWGKAARRSGNVFTDIDPTANQVLAKRLFGAINRDFEDASKGGTDIAKALKQANANYGKASSSISYLEKSALGKLLGEDVVDALGTGATASTKAPEAIAKKYLSMTPSEAKTVTNILRQHAPDALEDAKAFALRNGMEQATTDGKLSFAKFRTQMGDKGIGGKLKEMGFTPKEIADIKDVTDTMARAGDKLGVNLSKTASVSQAAGTLGTIGANILTHPGIALGTAVVGILTPYIASKALLTPQGRDLLRTVATTTDAAKRAAAVGALRSYGPAATAENQNPPNALEGAATTPAGLLQMPAPPNR